MSYQKAKEETYSLLGGINNKSSEYNQGPMEFRDLTNLHFSSPGALTKREGSTLYVGATVQGKITGGVEFSRLNGASYIVVSANTNIYTLTSSFNSFRSGLKQDALWDFTTFVDRLFCANGDSFFKFDGTNTTNFSLPNGATGIGITAGIGGGLSGVIIAGYGFLNDRGYFGPVSDGVTLSLNGITFGSIQYSGLTQPPGFGITAIAFYRSNAGQFDLVGTTTMPIGFTTTMLDPGWPQTTRIGTDALYFTLAPRFCELYNNQLFLAGFSNQLSTVYWSEIGEPEQIDPTYFFEVRTNDSDRITGMKAYNSALVITKERSFHRLSGDDPTNFLLQEVSDQYGCLSNRALVVFEDILWFLDSKGVVEYNGANVRIISNSVQPIFDSMNVAAARDQALAIHYRQLNEVWFSIPCNGASFNNCIVVYDYLVKAWTKYEGVNASVLFQAQGRLDSQSMFFGGYTGNVFHFGASLFGDNGAGITCSFDTRFLAQEGQTTQRMYRRFYLNLDPIMGVTHPIEVNFKTDYSTSVSLSRTMYQTPFQSRLDFGLSAKSIQAQVIHVSASLPLKINGFTFESRYLRSV